MYIYHVVVKTSLEAYLKLVPSYFSEYIKIFTAYKEDKSKNRLVLFVAIIISLLFLLFCFSPEKDIHSFEVIRPRESLRDSNAETFPIYWVTKCGNSIASLVGCFDSPPETYPS